MKYLKLLLIFFPLAGLGQVESKSKDTIEKIILSAQAEFLPPDSDFRKIDYGIGFIDSSRQATIKFIMGFQSYEKSERELRAEYLKPANRPIDLITTNNSPRRSITFIEERLAPGDSKYEDMYLITTLVECDNTSTYMVIGGYAKSQDKDLRKKFIRSALSIKSVN